MDEAEALLDDVLEYVLSMSRYWAHLPDWDPDNGIQLTDQDRCDGLLLSVLTALDGCRCDLPLFDLAVTAMGDDPTYGP